MGVTGIEAASHGPTPPVDFDWLVAFQRNVSAATTPAGCTDAFRAVLDLFDVSGFACGEVDLAVRERTTFYAIGWPEAWRRFYLEAGLVESDPLLELLRTRRDPFSWSEVRAHPDLSLESRRLFQVAANAGWTEGLVVPISRSATRTGLVSLAARRAPFSPAEKAQLTLASVFFHQHIRGLVADESFPEPPAGLTARELLCLRLVATGFSDREIAERLGISAATSHEHVENAKRKLKARTRASATAIAVSLGIIAA